MTTPSDPNQPPQNEPPQNEPPQNEPPQFNKPPSQPAPPNQPQWGPPPPSPQYGPPPNQPGMFPNAPAYAQPLPTDAAGRVLDPASGIYLPPGVVLASNGRRIGAYFLAIPLFIVTLAIGYVIWGLIVWGRGTTPALQVLGMKCYRVDNGEVPDWGRMFLREFVGRFLVESIVGIIGIISFILMLTTPKRQALHDMIATTTVVHDPNKILS
jgi:uncharacterized RDD family membrane protein YckC